MTSQLSSEHHVHGHDHGPEASDHVHADPEQAQLGPSSNGTVMLDIGGVFGALILSAPQSMVLAEIEISPSGRDTERTHVAIRERRGPGGSQWAAIYPKLRQGQYRLWDTSNQPRTEVTIVGGEVAQVDWR